jgi:hypothetical protein
MKTEVAQEKQGEDKETGKECEVRKQETKERKL